MSRFVPSNTKLALFFLLCVFAFGKTCAQSSADRTTGPPPSVGYVGTEACAKCHAEIAKNYANTAMARASGSAFDGLLQGDFVHAASGVHYRVYEENGRAWMSFERTGENPVSGKRELQYFIGSGHRGRTYLFSVDDFYFEAPINWYGQQKIWDMAPAYQKDREIPMNLPAVSSCLACHTSNSQLPVAGTENCYGSPLFAHAGITCERCHGMGAKHIAEPSAANIVNPDKLPPDRRDAICMQCHFEGKVAIQNPGRTLAKFEPGENLSDYVHYYLVSTGSPQGFGALSQTEALAQSVCKRQSGTRMSCTSCHDPHYSPLEEEKVAYYSGKCVNCHGEKFAAKHHAKQPDCRGCHMPASTTADIAHTEATDHRILRNPKVPSATLTTNHTPTAGDASQLVPFPPRTGIGSTRDVALAWASLLAGGMTHAENEAEHWLQKAAQESANDADVFSDLAFIEQRRGRLDQARANYQKALQVDPMANEAAMNLGVMEAQAGNVDKAIALLQGPFERIPGRSEVGINLAIMYCAMGKMQNARDTIRRVLEFNPDLGTAKKLQQNLNENSPSCSVR